MMKNSKQSKPKKFCVTVYRTTRNYGGPEEGGWWYNWTEVIQWVPVRKMTKARELLPILADKNYAFTDAQDIDKQHAKLGGVNNRGYYFAVIESHPYPRQQSSHRPRYE